MTTDDKKALYWTGGVTAAIIAIVAVVWLAGGFASTAL